MPPFPTRAGSRYALKRVYKAHALGPYMTMNDGSQQYGGICNLKLCPAKDKQDILISGGADGAIRVCVQPQMLMHGCSPVSLRAFEATSPFFRLSSVHLLTQETLDLMYTS